MSLGRSKRWTRRRARQAHVNAGLPWLPLLSLRNSRRAVSIRERSDSGHSFLNPNLVQKVVVDGPEVVKLVLPFGGFLFVLLDSGLMP
jgi:hypothetical protein